MARNGSANDEKHVFISYVHEDAEEVRWLVEELSDAGINVWIDSVRIVAGERWQSVIEAAIRESGAFLACFSSRSIARPSTYMTRELTLAFSHLTGEKTQNAWFIPVRLDECGPLANDVLISKAIDELQRVDIFVDRDSAVGKILRTLESLGLAPKQSRRSPNTLFETSDPELRQHLQMVRQLPITKLWSSAIEVENLSPQGKSEFLRILASDVEEPEMVQLLTTLSFVLFCDQVEARRQLGRPFLELLHDVMCDNRIQIVRRYNALNSLICIERKRGQEERLPLSPLLRVGEEKSAALVELEEHLLSSAALRRSQSNVEIKIIAGLFHHAPSVDRIRMIETVERFNARIDSAIDELALQHLRATEHSISYSELLAHVEVYYSFIHQNVANREVDPKYIEAHNLVLAARYATQSGEQQMVNDCVSLIGGEYTDEIEERYGKPTLYKTLVTLIVDSGVDPTISLFALLELRGRFGKESLLMDECIPLGVLKRKQAPLAPISVVEALCIGELAADSDDFLFLNALIEIIELLGRDERSSMKIMIKERFQENRSLQVLSDFLEGDIGSDTLGLALQRAKQTQEKCTEHCQVQQEELGEPLPLTQFPTSPPTVSSGTAPVQKGFDWKKLLTGAGLGFGAVGLVIGGLLGSVPLLVAGAIGMAIGGLCGGHQYRRRNRAPSRLLPK